MDKLETLFAEQAAFNASINKTRHLEDVTDDEWVQKFALALIVEAGELLDAAHFQWWKNPRPIDREHLKEEAVDVFHFAISVALAAGMDAQELFERWLWHSIFRKTAWRKKPVSMSGLWPLPC